MLETALAGLKAAGDRRGEIMARLQLALQTAKRGKVAEGLHSTDAALADARQIRDRWSEGYVLSQQLVMLNWADDDNGLEKIIDPTLVALRESGNRLPLMTTLGNVASRCARLACSCCICWGDGFDDCAICGGGPLVSVSGVTFRSGRICSAISRNTGAATSPP